MQIQPITPTPGQLDRLMAIWLQGNRDAHPFIATSYWEKMAPIVANQLPQATLYVVQEANTILGFAGLVDHDIAGIFIDYPYRHRGVGHALVQQLQADYDQLTLEVYTANANAQRFYVSLGFHTVTEDLDPDTQQPEQTMMWSRP